MAYNTETTPKKPRRNNVFYPTIWRYTADLPSAYLSAATAWVVRYGVGRCGGGQSVGEVRGGTNRQAGTFQKGSVYRHIVGWERN